MEDIIEVGRRYVTAKGHVVLIDGKNFHRCLPLDGGPSVIVHTFSAIIEEGPPGGWGVEYSGNGVREVRSWDYPSRYSPSFDEDKPWEGLSFFPPDWTIVASRLPMPAAPEFPSVTDHEYPSLSPMFSRIWAWIRAWI